MKPHHFLLLILSLFSLSACATSSASDDFSQDDPSKLVFLEGEYQILPEKTTLYGLMNGHPEHWGSVPFKRGELWVKDNRLIYASLMMDMSALRVFDEGGVEVEAVENQLKSDDHLGIALYPIARLDTTFIKPYVGFEDYTHEIEGDLSLHGFTFPIHLLARLTQNEDRLTLHAVSNIDLHSFGLLTEPSGAQSGVVDRHLSVEMDMVAQKKVTSPVQ